MGAQMCHAIARDHVGADNFATLRRCLLLDQTAVCCTDEHDNPV